MAEQPIIPLQQGTPMSRMLPTLLLLILSLSASAEPTSMLVFAGPPSGWIKEFDLAGNYQGDFIPPRTLASPQYAALAPDNTLYISSYSQNKVVRYDLDGNLLGEIVPNDGRIQGNTYLTIRNDELIVSGSNNGAIGVYDIETGDYLRSLVEPGIMKGAHTILWTDSGDMLISDGQANAIRRFDRDGNYLGDLTTNSELNLPLGMEFSPDRSSFYVSNFNDGWINEFDMQTGEHLGQLFQAGSAADDLTYGPDGLLYVTSYGSNSIYRYDHATGIEEIFIGSTSGLRSPNSVLFVPTPAGVILIGASVFRMNLRRRR
jgi:WD40 repeat protein